MHNKEQVFISYHIKIKTLPTKTTLSISKTIKIAHLHQQELQKLLKTARKEKVC